MNIINKLTFAYELQEVDDKMNGYINKDFNLLTILDNKWVPLIFSQSVPLRIGYNSAINKNYVYVSMSISSAISEETIKFLESETTKIVLAQDLKVLFPKIEKSLTLIPEVKAIPFMDSDKMKDHILLRAITNTVDDLKLFEKMSFCSLMREHIAFMATVNHLGIKKDKEYKFSELPIHDIEPGTNTLLIHKKILPMFKVFKVANDLIINNDSDTVHYELGKLMLMDLTFGEFVLNTLAGTKPEDTEPMKKVMKKAKATVKKNKVPELYYDLLMDDLAKHF